MTIRTGHTALLFAGALLITIGSGRAAAQCVGDCNGDGEVTINELILGVNIALGNDPVSACPAFASDGEVTIAQLIKGVNAALNGCPASGSPTPTATPTVTPTPVAGNCTLDPDDDRSSLAIYFGAADNPLKFPLSGSINVDCTVPENADRGECTCGIAAVDPISIPGIGEICISARPEPCPLAPVECNGGAPLGIDLRSNGNIGACAGNDACGDLCGTYCAGSGAVASLSGCTGYCSLSNDVSCSNDADCLPDKGACNGPDPVGANFDICQCSCTDAAAGPEGRPGEMQCNLGAALTVEKAKPCGDGDVTISLGDACVGLTTGTASTLITQANFSPAATVPKNDMPGASGGAPVACSALTADQLSGLKGRGVINFFGSALGDLAVLMAADCQ